MSRMLSTAKLILFAAIFGAMIFVGCNNSSSDDEPNGGGSTTVPDDPGTGGGTTDPDDPGYVMPATITIGEYTAKVEASEGVTYSDGKFILPKASDDENKAALSLVFDESIDISKYAGFYFSYTQSVGHKYSGSLQFFDSDEGEDENRTFAKWGIGSWSESGEAKGSVTTASSDTYEDNDTDEQKATKDAAYVDALKNLKMIKFAASTDFDWTVYGFKFTGSGNTGGADNPGEDDVGNAIELPGIDFSDSSTKDMVSASKDWASTKFTVQSGYLKIEAGGWASFIITYPSEQDLTGKKMKITGHIGDDYTKNENGLKFNVMDANNLEYTYSGSNFNLTTSDSSITSEYGWGESKDEENKNIDPDWKRIKAIKIYPQGDTGTLYIKSIEFVE